MMLAAVDKLNRARGVHPLLMWCILTAAVRWHREGRLLRITEGVRTADRQKRLLEQGRSMTLNSYHLKGLAVDVAILHRGKAIWDFREFERFNEYVQEAAGKIGAHVTWGGEWETLKDGPHFQLEGYDGWLKG